jgi:hypothetical protein
MMATINISTNDAKVIETTEEAAFAHVMKEILFKPAFDMDFGIWGVKTVWELLSLSKEDLDDITSMTRAVRLRSYVSWSGRKSTIFTDGTSLWKHQTWTPGSG